MFFIFYSITIVKSSAAPGTGFIENKGQWPSQVLYVAEIPGGKLYIESSRLLYSFYTSPHIHRELSSGSVFTKEDFIQQEDTVQQAHAFEVKFLNAHTTISAEGVSASSTIYNYFIGNDPASWAQGAKAFETVVLHNLYEGVDLKLYARGSTIKYDLIIVAGSHHLKNIEMLYNGLDSLKLKDGNLHLKTKLGELTEMKPYAYQLDGKAQKEVSCTYKLKGNKVTFNFNERPDSALTLVIDPLIIFSAYSGSVADNWGYTATYDDYGNAYSGGIVLGTGYPVSLGSYQSSFRGGTWDIGIMKYDSSGQKLIYATYLGGSAVETPQSLVVNHAGELLVMGVTSSTNFPVTNGSVLAGGTPFEPFDEEPYNNGSDLFIAKLNANGSKLTGSTYLGGTSNDGINFVSGQFDTNNRVESPLCKNYGDQFRGDIITDKNDNIYIASNTTSTNFPGKIVTFHGGTHDAVVVKLRPDLSGVIWSRYLGGSATDAAYSIKLDSSNTIFVAGGTTSTNFEGINGYKTTKGSDIDGWVAQLSADGQTILNATYLGTTSYDQVYFVDINTQQEIYVLGQTQGSYPVTAGVFTQSNGGHFIHKLTHDLHTSLLSTVFGSGGRTPNISPTAFLVNDCNKIFVAGWGGALNTTTIAYRQGPQIVRITRNFVGGDTNGLTVSADAYQKQTTGNDFYLMVLDTDASAFLYGTFLGGNTSVTHVDGGTSRFDKKGIVYHAVCAGCGGYSDFPSVNAAAGHATNAARNGAGCNNAVFKFDLATLRATLQTNSVELDHPGLDTVCYPASIVFQNLSNGAKYYVWDMGDGTTIQKTDKSSITHIYTQQGVYHVTLTAYNNETCEGTDVASVNVYVFENDIKVVDDGTICASSSYELSASGGASYTWFDKDKTIIAQVPATLVSPPDSTLYYLTATNNVGCETKDTVNVNVIKGPKYTIKIEQHYDCWNRPTTLFRYSSKDDYNYSWNLGDGTTTTEKEFDHNYPADGNYSVVFSASNTYCSYQDIRSVDVVTVKIPNVITPNDDEKNDRFEIDSPGQVNLEIYNRWGKRVFLDQNYQNTWFGAGLSAGVYYYKATIKETTTCKGWVQLLK
ncbi:MAG TPA: gliding motility-associated C-terminal domain-containing protein [Cyclobacteriaceae bacterium]|nr:gliding motility-associated C-terminal domain-containing protein [Cyclobacteriaceae bacterium]